MNTKNSQKNVKKIVKNENETIDFSKFNLKVNEEITVRFTDSKSKFSPFFYVKAWILKEFPQDNAVSNYLVTFGKNSKRERMVIPMTSIHASNLANRTIFN